MVKVNKKRDKLLFSIRLSPEKAMPFDFNIEIAPYAKDYLPDITYPANGRNREKNRKNKQ